MTSCRLNPVAALAAVLGFAAVAAGCNLEPSAAGQPTYEADVQPILLARCVRCHGSPPLADPTSSNPGPPVSTVRFDVFGDTGCDTDAVASCVHGAQYEAMQKRFKTFLNLDPKMGGMPPSPAAPLTSYQKDTILNWEAEPTPLER